MERRSWTNRHWVRRCAKLCCVRSIRPDPNGKQVTSWQLRPILCLILFAYGMLLVWIDQVRRGKGGHASCMAHQWQGKRASRKRQLVVVLFICMEYNMQELGTRDDSYGQRGTAHMHRRAGETWGTPGGGNTHSGCAAAPIIAALLHNPATPATEPHPATGCKFPLAISLLTQRCCDSAAAVQVQAAMPLLSHVHALGVRVYFTFLRPLLGPSPLHRVQSPQPRYKA